MNQLNEKDSHVLKRYVMSFGWEAGIAKGLLV
jgi:hypothetical protein